MNSTYNAVLQALLRVIQDHELDTPAGRRAVERARQMVSPEPHSKPSRFTLVLAEDDRELYAALCRPAIERPEPVTPATIRRRNRVTLAERLGLVERAS